MNKRYLIMSVAIVLVVVAAAAAMPMIEKGLASRSSTENTDTVSTSLYIKADPGLNKITIPSATYSFDNSDGTYTLADNYRKVTGLLSVGGPESQLAELHTAVRYQDISSWVLIDSISIKLVKQGTNVEETPLTAVIYETTKSAGLAGDPVTVGMVGPGTYSFEIEVYYKSTVSFDPREIHGSNMVSDVVFYLEEKYVTIHFDRNEGIGEMGDQMVTKMFSELNHVGFTRSGYAFEGWSVDQESTVTYVDGAIINVRELLIQGKTTLNLKAQWKADGLYDNNFLYASKAKVKVVGEDNGVYPGNAYYVGEDASIRILGTNDDRPILVLLREGVSIDLTYPNNTTLASAMVCFYSVDAVVGDTYQINGALGSKWLDNDGKLTSPARVTYHTLPEEQKLLWGQFVYEPYKAQSDNGQNIILKASNDGIMNTGSNKTAIFTKSAYSLTGKWERIGAYGDTTITFTLDKFTGTISSAAGSESGLPEDQDEVAFKNFTGSVIVHPSNQYDLEIAGWTSGSVIVERGGVTEDSELGGHELYYRITFNVTNGTLPVSGASVTFGDQNSVTDVNGVAKFSTVNATVSYTITKAGYTTQSETLVVNKQAHTVPISLVPVSDYYNATDKALYSSTSVVVYSSGKINSGGIYYFGNDASVTIGGLNGGESTTRDNPILVLVEEGKTVTVTYPNDASSNNTLSVCFFSVKKSDGYAMYTFTKGLGTKWYDNDNLLRKNVPGSEIGEYHNIATDSEKEAWGEWVYEPYQANDDDGQQVKVSTNSTNGAVNIGSTKNMVYTKSSYNLTGVWERIGAFSGKEITFNLVEFTGTVSSGAGGDSLPFNDEIYLDVFTGTVKVVGGGSVTITKWSPNGGSVLVKEGSVKVSSSVLKNHELKSRVTFTVKNSSEAISGATVKVGSISGTTNDSGVVTLDVPYGSNQAVNISKASYSTYEGTINVGLAAIDRDPIVLHNDGYYSDGKLYAVSDSLEAKVIKNPVGSLVPGKAYYISESRNDLTINASQAGLELNKPILILIKEGVKVKITYPAEAVATNSAMVCFFSVEGIVGDAYKFTNALGAKWIVGEGASGNLKLAGNLVRVEYHNISTEAERLKWGEWVYEPYQANVDAGQYVYVEASLTAHKATNAGASRNLVYSGENYTLTPGIWERIGVYSGRTSTFTMAGFTGTVSSGNGGASLPVKDEVKLTNFSGTVRVVSNTSIEITAWTEGNVEIQEGQLTSCVSVPEGSTLKTRITYTVTDASSVAIQNANVSIGAASGNTDAEGKITLSVADGTGVNVYISKPEYSSYITTIDVGLSVQNLSVTLHDDGYYDSESKKLYALSDKVVIYSLGDLIPGKAYYFGTDMTEVSISASLNARGAPILVLIEEGVTIKVTYPEDADSANTQSVCFYGVRKVADGFVFTKGLGSSWIDDNSRLIAPTADDIREYYSKTDQQKATWGDWVYEAYCSNGDNGQFVYVKGDSTKGVIQAGSSQDMVFTKSSYYLTGNWSRIGVLDGITTTFDMEYFNGIVSSGKGGATLEVKDEVRLVDFTGRITVIGGSSITVNTWTSGDIIILKGSLTNVQSIPGQSNSLNMNIESTLASNISWLNTNVYNKAIRGEGPNVYTLSELVTAFPSMAGVQTYYYVDLGVANHITSIVVDGVAYEANSTFRLSIGHNSFIEDKVWYVADGNKHLYIATQFVGLYPSVTINFVECEYATVPVTTELTSTVTEYNHVEGFSVNDPVLGGYDKRLILRKAASGDHGSVKIEPSVELDSSSIILCKLEYTYSDGSTSVSYAYTDADQVETNYYVGLYILYNIDLTDAKYSSNGGLNYLTFTYYVNGVGWDTQKFEILVQESQES